VRGQEREERVGGHRPCEQEALSDLAAELVKRLLLLRKLDAFGDETPLDELRRWAAGKL